MWKLTVFEGNELILDHSQNEYLKVIKFTMNSVVELINKGARDFRVVMVDKHGHIYFSAIGEDTQVVKFKKEV